LCPLLFCNEIFLKGEKKSCKKGIKRKPILEQRVAGAALLRILKNLEKGKKKKSKEPFILFLMEFGGKVLKIYIYIYSFSFTKNVATLAIIHSRN